MVVSTDPTLLNAGRSFLFFSQKALLGQLEWRYAQWVHPHTKFGTGVGTEELNV